MDTDCCRGEMNSGGNADEAYMLKRISQIHFEFTIFSSGYESGFNGFLPIELAHFID